MQMQEFTANFVYIKRDQNFTVLYIERATTAFYIAAQNFLNNK
jgi:hypothetical protein